MAQTQDELKKSIETLKGKVAEAKKASTKPSDEKLRGARKALKRAQRRLRQATGKKLATIRKFAKGAEK